jgi:hypothetical protein
VYISRQLYPYLYYVVVGYAWSNDRESCAGGTVSIGKASVARLVKGDDPGPLGWVLGLRITATSHKNIASEIGNNGNNKYQ